MEGVKSLKLFTIACQYVQYQLCYLYSVCNHRHVFHCFITYLDFFINRLYRESPGWYTVISASIHISPGTTLVELLQNKWCLSAPTWRNSKNGAKFVTSQKTFNLNIDVVLMTEVWVVMTLQGKGVFHGWIQSFLTYPNLRLVTLCRAKYV